MKNHLEAIKAQMELDRKYWFELCNLLRADDVPLYNNQTIYTSAILMFSELSGIPVEDINHFIYEQDFGSKSGKSIEEFLNEY